MARRSRSRFVRPPKKTMIWLGDNPVSAPSTVPANSALLFSVLNAGALALRPFTILRSRGIIRWESDQAAVSEQPNGAFGEIVVTDNATTIGVTAVPDPISDPDADWFLYQSVFADFNFLSSVGFNEYAGDANVFAYDSKAMRKVGPNDDIAGVISNQNSAHGGKFMTIGRQLIQLH